MNTSMASRHGASRGVMDRQTGASEANSRTGVTTQGTSVEAMQTLLKLTRAQDYALVAKGIEALVSHDMDVFGNLTTQG